MTEPKRTKPPDTIAEALLTEERIREIVREEIAHWSESTFVLREYPTHYEKPQDCAHQST